MKIVERRIDPAWGLKPKSDNVKDGEPKLVNANRGASADPNSVAEVVRMNKTRPEHTNPIPNELVQRYGGRINDVWWHAKGREEDPTIGVEVDGVRKTFGGYVWNDWWYFQKTVHYSDDPNEPNTCYWYRKRKVPDPDNPGEFKTIEEYVGSKLKDLDTGLPIEVPEELQHDPSYLCPND